MMAIGTRIARAKELLQTARHATMATVNEDGSPHNTPFYFLHSDDLTKIYWGSRPDSLHSLNVVRSGQLFVVLFDLTVGGGLYIKAEHGHIAEGSELEAALRVHNAARGKEGKAPLPVSYYKIDSPQRMWSADVMQLWVNGAVRNADGHIVRDLRYEISAKDLLS